METINLSWQKNKRLSNFSVKALLKLNTKKAFTDMLKLKSHFKLNDK